MQRHELLDLALALERELVAARAEIVLLTKRKNEFSNGWDAALEQRDLAVEALRLCNIDQFTTAAELADAVAKERERCAKVCDEMANSRYLLKENIEIMLACADAIRKGEE
jgi:hypothetical protein